VRLVNDYSDFYNLVRTNEKTIRRIKVLALGAQLPLAETMTHIPTWNLFLLRELETLILVVEMEAGRNEGGSIQEYMQDRLIKARDRLRMHGRKEFEWKLPVVMVINPQAFENHL
jgi:hypothetical protein